MKLPLASCTPYCSASDVLYAGSSSLAAFASLPTLAGSSIFWQNDFVPSSTPAPGYTPGTPTGVVGTSKPTTSSAPSSGGGGGGLSTGAKAGIGVGAAVGGILLLAALAGFLVTRSRRREQQRRQQQQQQGFEPTSSGIPPSTTPGYSNHGGFNQYSQDMTMYPPSSGGYPSPPLPYSTTYYHHELGSPTGYDAQAQTQGAAYMGYKSELPADEVPGSGYNPNLGAQPGPEQSKTPLSAASTVLAPSPQPEMPRHNSTSGDISPRYTDR